MITKILDPLDGSQLSECALEPAVTLARQPGAEMLLVRVPVADTFGFTISEARQIELRYETQDYLETICEANKQPGLIMHTQLIEGDVAGAIVDTAASEQADLIIMSTHGYSGLTRWVLGSVTEKVLRSAPCPVLAVRAVRQIRKILITLDGSDLAEDALEPGLSLAQGLGAEISLLRVVPHLTPDTKLEEVERGLSRRSQNDLIDEAKEYLQARVARYARSGLEIKADVRTGSVADNILEYVEVFGIDLIGMATHGRTGLKRWVYGSVTAKVLRGASCSMLVIRPTEAELK